jgi:hypothetical protein
MGANVRSAYTRSWAANDKNQRAAARSELIFAQAGTAAFHWIPAKFRTLRISSDELQIRREANKYNFTSKLKVFQRHYCYLELLDGSQAGEFDRRCGSRATGANQSHEDFRIPFRAGGA